MITRSIGTGSRWLLEKIVSAIAATGINPNVLTAFGLVVNFWAAVMFATGMFRSAAAIIFFAGFLDMLDGQVARREQRVTAFGAFLTPRSTVTPTWPSTWACSSITRSTDALPTSSSQRWPRPAR